MTVATATSGGTSVVVSEQGAKGLDGTDGTDGTGFNQVRKSKLDNPLMHLFKANQLQNVSAPLNTEADLAWTRASTATYVDRYGVVQTAATDTPREEANGFLIEGASTNIATYSEQHNNGAFTTIEITVAADSVAAPDGTTTADKITATAVENQHAVYRSLTVTTADWTHSVYAKDNGDGWVRIGTGVNYAFFDLSTGVTGSALACTPEITSVGNGWYRCAITASLTAGALAFYVFTATGEGVNSYTGDGVSGIYIWGEQLEVLPFASSYIPTTTASVTRAADLVSAVSANNFDETQGSISLTYDVIGILGISQQVIGISDGTFNNEYNLTQSATNLITQVTIGGSTDANYLTATAANTTYNVVIPYQLNNIETFVNGATVGSATSFALPVVTTVNLGNDGVGATRNLFGHLKDLRIYDFILNSNEVTYLAD